VRRRVQLRPLSQETHDELEAMLAVRQPLAFEGPRERLVPAPAWHSV